MSVNWDNLIGSHFKNKNKIDFGTILEMVSKQMESLPPVTEELKTQTRAERFLLSLPKFTPSEAWGDPNSQARLEMERYFKRVGGKSLAGKLEWLQRIQEPPGKRGPKVQRVISSLIILESLASCVNDFSDPSAGFVFEGFLAALLGGHQVSGPVSGNLPIEDIMAFSVAGVGVPMSLKLLRHGGSVKGSYTNLIDAMEKYPEMIYVVAYKTKEGGKTGAITIGEFKITRENVLDIVAHRNEHLLKIKTKIPGFDLTPDDLIAMAHTGKWEELYPILQRTAGYSRTPTHVQPAPDQEPSEDQNAPEIDVETSVLEEGLYPIIHIPPPAILTEGKGDIQWHLTQADLASRDLGAWKELAVLNIDPEHLKKVVIDYSKVLNNEIMTLFETVKELSENLNLFYIEENRNAALKRGEKAINNAQDIETQASAQVEASKKEDTP